MVKRILNWIGWVGVGLVLAAVALLVLRPELATVRWWLAMAGLACVLLYLASQWREVLAAFGSRSVRYGSMSFGSVLLVIGILAGVNYIGGRQNVRWDVTEARLFSVSDQTRRVLGDLDRPLAIKVFDRNMEPWRDRLDEYQHVSRHVSIEYIDPDRERAVATGYGIRQYGTVVIEYDDRAERATTNSEQEITAAIVRAVQGGETKVYFVQGHGERDPTSHDERGGYSAAVGELETENFAVESLPLAQAGRVPDDADIVVVAGPETDFFEGEIGALRRYLDAGGKLLLMLDPPERPESAPLTNLIGLAREWSIDVGTNVVVDATGMGQLIGSGPEVPIVLSYPQHPITNNFNRMTAFPLARSVDPIAGGVEGRQAQVVAETSANSWAETDLAALAAGGEIRPDDSDRTGPVPLAAAVSHPVEAPAQPETNAADEAEEGDEEERPALETRVVVFGDSDFASNGVLGLQGNRDLFLNTMNWLAEQESLIDIRPREPDDRRVTMTAGQMQQVAWFAMLGVPAVIFGTGVYAWWRRRR